ncbi:hypothetical protein Rsw2DRAFT_2816 [Rhodobacter ferrooxidans]|uniref:Uncharacterized protein n=1 Tax=Rhodobacter ferrooxidans TaxID=371731 RepID=C8S438_9RHOB|nr:hypothetical protein Rsw2DRAFT_2816 [Rhodobacter sp. SW2]
MPRKASSGEAAQTDSNDNVPQRPPIARVMPLATRIESWQLERAGQKPAGGDPDPTSRPHRSGSRPARQDRPDQRYSHPRTADTRPPRPDQPPSRPATGPLAEHQPVQQGGQDGCDVYQVPRIGDLGRRIGRLLDDQCCSKDDRHTRGAKQESGANGDIARASNQWQDQNPSNQAAQTNGAERVQMHQLCLLSDISEAPQKRRVNQQQVGMTARHRSRP